MLEAAAQAILLPGVGALVALTVRAAIDNPGRFRSSRATGPWAGLTPRRERSGEREIVGHITKAGDAMLRTALFYAATVLAKGLGLQVARRRGLKQATIAVARRIGVTRTHLYKAANVILTRQVGSTSLPSSTCSPGVSSAGR